MFGDGSVIAADRAQMFRRLGWGAGVVVLVLALMLWAQSVPARWERLGVSPMQPIFVDTGAILAAGQAYEAGADPYAVPNLFDYYGRPHVYGPGWLVTGRLGLTVTDTFWVGALVVFFFLLGMTRLFEPLNALSAGCLVALLISPPVMMALNRGNNDLVILMMGLVAAWMVGRPGQVGPLAAVAMVGMSTLLKFYPLMLAPALLSLPGNWRQHGWRFGGFALFVTLAVAWQWSDYVSARQALPLEESIFSYQASYAVELLGIIFLVTPMTTWAGALIAFVLVAFLISRGRHDWWAFLPTGGRWGFLTAGGALVWVSCLLIGPNYSYRFVWMLPLAAWGWRRRNETRPGAKMFLLLVTGLAWSWWPKHTAANQVQYGVAGADEMLMNAIGFEQVFVLGSLVVCVWMLIGWTLRRLQELFFGGQPGLIELGGSKGQI